MLVLQDLLGLHPRKKMAHLPKDYPENAKELTVPGARRCIALLADLQRYREVATLRIWSMTSVLLRALHP